MRANRLSRLRAQNGSNPRAKRCGKSTYFRTLCARLNSNRTAVRKPSKADARRYANLLRVDVIILESKR